MGWPRTSSTWKRRRSKCLSNWRKAWASLPLQKRRRSPCKISIKKLRRILNSRKRSSLSIPLRVLASRTRNPIRRMNSIKKLSWSSKLSLCKSLNSKKNLGLKESLMSKKNRSLRKSLKSKKRLRLKMSLRLRKRLRLKKSLKPKKRISLSNKLSLKRNLKPTKRTRNKLSLRRSLKLNKSPNFKKRLKTRWILKSNHLNNLLRISLMKTKRLVLVKMKILRIRLNSRIKWFAIRIKIKSSKKKMIGIKSKMSSWTMKTYKLIKTFHFQRKLLPKIRFSNPKMNQNFKPKRIKSP